MKTLRVAFRCPHCSHAFLRGVGDIAGTTRCPKCCEKFPRLAGCRSGGDATAVRSEVCNRNQARNKRLIGPLVTHEVIRGDQVPHSTAEAKFKAKSAAKGWRPHRPSWPDFLVETDSGTIAVEVKARSDDLSPEQIATFTVLERAGLPVYIWKDAAGLRGCLVRWAGGGAMDRVSNSGILRGKVEDAVKSLMLAERGQA